METRNLHASFADFVAYGEREPVTEYRSSRGESGDRDSFTGCKNYAEALRLAREGWPEGRELAEKHRANFAAIIGERIHRPVLSHDVHGFMPDVGAFCVGEPENMFSRETVEVNAPGKIIRVVVSGSISGGISAAQIIRRGALICALIDALESAKYSCELVSAFRSSAGGNWQTDIIPVKAAGEPLDIDKAAFAFAHPAMLRRLIFAALEQNAPYMNRAGYGYGNPEDMLKADQGDLYFNRVFLGNVADAQVITWFKGLLAPLGIAFDE